MKALKVNHPCKNGIKSKRQTKFENCQNRNYCKSFGLNHLEVLIKYHITSNFIKSVFPKFHLIYS